MKTPYLEAGWLDVEGILDGVAKTTPFVIFMGGRQTGKTYGIVKYLVERKTNFVFVRRTQKQADMVMNDETSPFRPIFRDLDIEWESRRLPKTDVTMVEYWQAGTEDRRKILMCALSTVGTIRGFSAAEFDAMFFDEFIRTVYDRKMKGEGDAFFDACETIDRSRELMGIPPVKAILASNSNTIMNDVIIQLGLVGELTNMRKKGQEIKRVTPDLTIALLQDSPISEKKRDTALYRLTEGTAFHKMAIANEFADAGIYKVKSMPLQEYRPTAVLGELCFYEHKSRDEVHVSRRILGTPPVYTLAFLKRFTADFGTYLILHNYGLLTYEDETAAVLLTKYIDGV